jgi:FHS family L-fucose permease-like MFS transporter
VQHPSASAEQASTQPSPERTYRGPFTVMTVLFFLWGFMTVFNDILIPRFKEAFTLNYFQAMLVQFAFFGAYFIGALLYYLISAVAGDPIARIGYKNGVVIGLLISAAGSALFWPAADALSYTLFLVALFVVGLGFAMLQIAANPYVTILGPERTASSRLNLAQAFNSVGTTIGPLIGGYLIFQYFAKTGAHGAESVKVPYIAFCVVFLVLAGVFLFTHLPDIAGEGKIERGVGALKHPHVVLGQKSVAGLDPVEASKYVSLFWGGMLIGRFMGAVELSEMRKANKQLLLAAIPIVAFGILAALRGWAIVRNYLPFLAVCWLLFQFGKALAGRTLVIFSATIMLLLVVAIVFGGRLAMWCVVGVGLFTSIGWPNIFSLALEGMGVYKSQVSSLLVMAILGGALLPPLQGHIADVAGLQLSYIVPLVAYAYVAFYGWKGHTFGNRRLPEAA